MFTKSVQTRIEEANKVFVATLEKLKSVQTDIINQMGDNNSQITKLKEDNDNLDAMKSRTEKQIGEIEKIIG